jgi:hypothetical protein
MTVFFPIFELLDRYVISLVKFERTLGANQAEFVFYQRQVQQIDLSAVVQEMQQLEHIHRTIWDLEAQLKSDKEHELGLEEIGRRAIAIRDWNRQRIAMKNAMADKLGQGDLHEIKQDHLSQ